MRQRERWKACAWTVALMVLGLLAYPVPGECSLYGTDSEPQSRLFQINPADASSVVVGTVSNWHYNWYPPMFGLAYNAADGFLYGTDAGFSLIRIDRVHGYSTLVGLTYPNFIGRLTYNPTDGFLYGIDMYADIGGIYLSRINPANGSTTVVGVNQYQITSLAYNPTDGFLYGTDRGYPDLPSHLLRINPANGSTTVVGTVPDL
jgi:hypothetical protein